MLPQTLAPDASAQEAPLPGEVASSSTTLYFLDYRGRVLSAAEDGSDLRVLVDELRTAPDGIAVDMAAGHVYWSNMGRAKEADGSIMRADLDGGNVTTIVPSGGTHTAKQLVLDIGGGKLYWADREGMRIQRVNVDGTRLETLVEIATGDEAREDAANWAVGIALDTERGHLYWTQKGGDNEGVGTIRRASIDIPSGETAGKRSDVEILFAELPEPIDLALDLQARHIYWTDRGDAPRGNTVNRAPMDPPTTFDPAARVDAEILFGELNEAIGIDLDLARNRLFVTDLGGNVYRASLDGSKVERIGEGLGTLTGLKIGSAGPRAHH